MIKEYLTYDDRKVFKHIYNDIEDLVQTLKTAKTNRVFQGKSLSSQKHGTESSFHDFTTYEGAMNALEYGYDKYFKDFMEKVEKAKNIVSKIEEPKTGNQKNDVVGYVPIIPNTLLNIPQNMINSNITKKKIPKARIFIEFSECGGVSASKIIKYKAVIFALIDLMERKGIRCEVWIIENSKECSEICSYCIKLKDFFQPINFYKLQFPIISSDMLRRINFRMIETHEDVHENWHDGYGQPLRSYAKGELDNGDKHDEFKIAEKIKEIVGLTEDDIYIPNTNLISDSDDTKKIIKKLLTKTKLKDYIEYKGD